MTVSKAAERSSRMWTDDLESAFAIRKASVTDSSAISVERPLMKPDWLASSLLFCERNNDTWLKTTRLTSQALRGQMDCDWLSVFLWFCLQSHTCTADSTAFFCFYSDASV